VVEDDEDEGALRYAARLSSGHDLVEEFIGYGVWPLAHGWVLGEVCPWWMSTLGDRLVRSPAFAVDLRGRNSATFVREVEAEAVKIVGKYVPRTETLRSWDIHGSNVRLNHVFELNHLPYAGYPGDDDAYATVRRGKKAVATVDEGPSRGAAPSATAKKRKLGTTTEGLGASERFVVELLETCAVPGETMSSPELRESSARMLKVTRGRWPRNVSIPRAAGEDMFTSRLAREMKIFPYGRNVATVVTTVMEKDRQDAPWKRRAFARVGDLRREVKMAWAGAKPVAPGANMPPPGGPGPSVPLPALPTQERRPASPTHAAKAAVGGAEVSLDISVEDYTMGGVTIFDTHTRRGPVGEFLFWTKSYLTVVQERSLGNWLLSRHRRWLTLWLWWRVRRGLRRIRGLGFVPAAKFLWPPPRKTWPAQLCLI
jgi:hypothetical protein